MGRRVASWFIRFAVAAVIYASTGIIWINDASGWGQLGMFVKSLAFGLLAVLAWGGAIGLGTLVRHAATRLLLHPALTVTLFVALSVAILGWSMDTPWGSLWEDLRPFAALLVAVTVVDAVIGLLLERWAATPRRPQ